MSQLKEVNFLADGMQLEALWQQNEPWRAEAARLRNQVGPAVDGEFFFTQARRALATSDVLIHRHCRRLEIMEAETILWAWLTARVTPCELVFMPTAGQVPGQGIVEKSRR